MLKFAMLASSMALTLAAPANAEILFRGAISITNAVNCPNGPNISDLDNAQFHPKAAPGNAPFSALNIIHNYSATSFALNGKFNSSFQQVTNNSIGWSDYTPEKPSSVLVSSQDPATITAETGSVTLVGKIKNPFGEAGSETCVATFRMVGVKSD